MSSCSNNSRDIYRKYYGLKISVFLLAIFYLAMAAAALVVEFLFGALHLIPQERKAQIVEGAIRWNYTTILNIVFLALALVLVIRFFRTGGPAMMRMMSGSGKHEHDPSQHAHQNPLRRRWQIPRLITDKRRFVGVLESHIS